MSNITLFNSAVPAHVKAAGMSDLAKSLAGGNGGGGGKRISTKGGVFRLYADGKEIASIEDRHLDVVIVRAAPKVSRTFYAGQYVDGQATAPTCWSQDGDVPDPTCKTKQSDTCMSCPQNQKGSGQGDSRACRYSQRLAVVLANDIEGDVMQLSLAATSIFGREENGNYPLQAYARAVMSAGGDPAKLVTRLKFDTKAPVPKLFFKPERWLTEEEIETCTAKGESPEAVRAVTMTVSQQDGVASAPAPLAIGNAPKSATSSKAAKPAVKPIEVQEDEAAEPEVRKAAPAKNAVPAAGKLAATLSEWDDE